jgi:hypothetical protein
LDIPAIDPPRRIQTSELALAHPDEANGGVVIKCVADYGFGNHVGGGRVVIKWDVDYQFGNCGIRSLARLGEPHRCAGSTRLGETARFTVKGADLLGVSIAGVVAFGVGARHLSFPSHFQGGSK